MNLEHLADKIMYIQGQSCQVQQSKDLDPVIVLTRSSFQLQNVTKKQKVRTGALKLWMVL